MKRYVIFEIDTHQLPFCCSKKYRQKVKEILAEIKEILLTMEGDL